MVFTNRLALKSKRLFVFVYYLLYGHPPGEKVKKFILDTLFSLIGFSVSTFILSIISILAGRILGPKSYGEYAVVLVISQLLSFFVLPGLDTAVMRDMAANMAKKEKQQKIIGTAFVTYCILVSIVAVVVFVASGWLSALIKVKISVVYVAYIFTIVMALRFILDGVMRGLSLFKIQTAVRIVDSIVVLLFFTIFAVKGIINGFILYVFVILLGALVSIFLYIITLKRKGYIRPVFSWVLLKELLGYGKYALLGIFSNILLTNLDRLMFQKYLGPVQVGRFTAYYTVTISLAAIASGIIVNVLFPLASSESNRWELFVKIDKAVKIIFIPATIVLFIISFWAIKLFGNNYSLGFNFNLLMSISGILFSVVSIYANVIASFGTKEVKFVGIRSIVAGVLYLLLLILLVPHYGITISPLLFAASMIYLLAELFFWRSRHIKL